MDTESVVSHLFRFAGYEFHASTGELQRDGRGVLLPEQACRVLLALLGAEGEVVSREELRTALWPGRSYGDFEGGLNTAIFKLRQALDDDGAEHRIVGTLPRRGYRMLVPVEKIAAARKAVEGEPPPGAAGGPGYSPQERFPAVGPIWAPEALGGADPGTGEVGPRAGRDRPALPRKGRIAGGALLLILGIGGVWIGADADLRQAVAFRMRRMVLPIQALTGKVVRNRLGMAFVRIPAGSFTMGTDTLPVEWGDMNFRPAHRVTLSRPFLMQDTEVTVGQFKAFVADTNYRTDGERTDGIRVSKGLQPTAASQGYLFERSMKRLDASWRN
ncbi:MAG TPA: SUMF1/EgtB/PvdO family nonheme iron enzyme, partial [Holophaga sp.]|nr:SUMF1/EgtB/PvdO family nonheme iron enzyme [Holophaga sp.]